MLGEINTAVSDVREAAICFAYVADIIVNQKRSLCVWSAVGFHGRKESPCIWRYGGVANLVSACKLVLRGA